MKALAIPLIVLAALVACTAAFAQPYQPQTTPAPDFAKTVIHSSDLGHRTYMLQGEGGNILLAVATDGIIMVDDEYAPLHDKIKAAIAAISPKPVRYLVLTHFHRDHTGGNADFAQDGATIVAHKSVTAHLAAGSKNGVSGSTVPPAPSIALPKETYEDAMTLHLQDRDVRLMHVANAHTDGDTMVYLPDANVLATGDIVTFERYPNVDYLYGGSVDGMIAGVGKVLQLTKDDTKIVPGHGPLGTRKMVQDYRAMLISVRDRIRALIAEGKTEDQIVAMRPNADYDEKLKVSAQAAGNFIRVVYRSLKK